VAEAKRDYKFASVSGIRSRYPGVQFIDEPERGITERVSFQAFLQQEGSSEHLPFTIINEQMQLHNKVRMWQGFLIRIIIHSRAVSDNISVGKRKGDPVHLVVHMRVAAVFELLSPIYKMRVMSYVTHRCTLQQIADPKIPGKHVRYNVLHGAKPKLSKEA
jgi:hypothetical protein